MSTVHVIPSSRDLLAEVAEHLQADGGDYSRNLVVFPGKRPAHFLRRLLAEKIGRAFIPPRILSMDGFIDFLYTTHLGLSHPEVQVLDAVAILHELYLDPPGRAGTATFDALDAFLPLGMKLFGEFEELKMAGVQKRRLDETLGDVALGNGWLLRIAYEAFYEKVNALGGCTRALKYSVVADFLSEEHLAEYASIVIAGFFALTPSENKIFRTLKSLKTAAFLFQQGEGLDRRLQDMGWKPARAADVPAKPDEISCYQSPDSHGQAFGLAELLNERGANGKPLDVRTVVVLPDPAALVPLYHQVLELLRDDEFNISLGYPVARTPVFGFLRSLLNIEGSAQEGKLFAPDYLKHVLHPFTKNILFNGRSDVTRILLHTIEEYLAGEKSLTYFSLNEIEDEMKLHTRAAERVSAVGIECTAQQLREHLVAIHDHTIRRLTGARTLGDLSQRCRDVLLYIDEHSTARTHPFFTPYVDTLIESLEGLAGSRLAGSVIADRARAVSVLDQCMAGAEVPFPGTPLTGLQVLGFLETRNIRFDTVYVLDVNEDTLPGSGGEYPLIPRTIREKLGLPTSRQREEIAAYYFDVLVKGARSVHLFFSENAWKEKSRFIEQLLWKRQREEGKDDVRQYIRSIGYNVSLANTTPPRVSKSEGVVQFLRGFSYHATALDMYLRCPLKFYYRYVLGLREKEEVAGDIDSGDVGSFVHELMRLFFKDFIGKRLSPGDLAVARLDAILQEQFDAWFGSEKTGAKHVLRKQVRTQLGRFITNYQVPLCRQEEVTLLEIESKITGLSKRGFTFNGKLDRVERRGSKTYILDYKTGGDEKRLGIDFAKLVVAQRETWGEAIGSLQLPMYMMLYAGIRKASVDDIVPAYLLLGRNRIDEGIEMRMFDEGVAASELFAKLEEVIFGLLKEVTDPEVPFTPTEDLQEQCPYCPFTTICGTGWVKRAGS